MSDRELLEMAALAAGIDALDYRRGSDAYYYDDPKTGREEWNPLANDGQALRLAVKLGIQIIPYPIYSEPKHTALAQKKGVLDDKDDDVRDIAALELYGVDPDAATRRAIVRAAAAIGKAIKTDEIAGPDGLWAQGNDLPYVGNPLFEVMMDGGFKRIVQRDTRLPMDNLMFKDGTHPMQNAICDRSTIRQWRVKGVI